ncbi:MAG: hypothetical protein Q8L27_04800 [archaeon]|nr:hypothetical protein [archaeon]
MEKEGLCRICGQSNCKKHTFLFQNIKKISEFSGSSPPEIFVGRYDYPNVNIGILSPQEKGDMEILSSQELWHKNKLKMPEIMNLRSKLIYGRTKSNIRKVLEKTKFISTMQEVAMTSKSISTEFKLQKPVIEKNREKDSYSPIINNAVMVKSVRLEENPIIKPKIEYLTNDTDVKSKIAILELEKAKTPTSTIIKILSAGLLGLGINRKLVPTRWAITAIDEMISKEKLKKIKHHPEITDIQLFTAEYLGNHYEFLLLPDKFSFEVTEINNINPESSWHDYEGSFGRKTYATSVTGAYYANRLALCEYLEKMQRQASCLVFREIGSEYTQSMGVGILRQISREAFSKTPKKFSTINDALNKIQSRIKLPISVFTEKSIILKEYGKQKRLENWFG